MNRERAQIKEIKLALRRKKKEKKNAFVSNRFGRAMLFGSIELCEYFKKLFISLLPPNIVNIRFFLVCA